MTGKSWGNEEKNPGVLLVMSCFGRGGGRHKVGFEMLYNRLPRAVSADETVRSMGLFWTLNLRIRRLFVHGLSPRTTR